MLADQSLDRDIAEYERQFREILEHCPAGLNVVDEDGQLLFHNARIRELLGYSRDELHLFDTRKFWHDLNQRARIIKALHDNAEQVLNEEAIWRPGQLLDDVKFDLGDPTINHPQRIGRGM